MNLDEFRKNGGITTVPNPKYNPRAKKNKQPKFINNKNLGKQSIDPLLNYTNEHIDNQYSVNYDEIEKYTDYGLNYHGQLGGLDKELADAQSGLKQFGNMLVQTVVGEVGLGTVRGGVDLVSGFFDLITGQVFKDDYNFSNPVSATLQKWQEGIENDVAPIYTDPEKDILHGGLASWGWWMKNLPSVASSITLLLPARGATLAVSKLANLGRKGLASVREIKAARAIQSAEESTLLGRGKAIRDIANQEDKISKWSAFFNNPDKLRQFQEGGKMFSEAAMMRVMENYQESSQSFTEAYSQAYATFNNMSDAEWNTWCTDNKDFVDGLHDKTKDGVAKAIANRAANRTFLIDTSNVVFDLIQLRGLKDLGLFGKTVKNKGVKDLHNQSMAVAGSTEKAAAEAMEKAAGGKLKRGLTTGWNWLRSSGTIVAEESTEGIEEAINYIAQQEGLSYAKSMYDRESNFTSTSFWNQRLFDYMSSPELQESAFWGVMGGFMFGAGGRYMEKRRAYKANKAREELEKKLGIHTADEEGNPMNHWISMWDDTNVQAAKRAILARTTRLANLQQQAALYADGKNPFVIDADRKYVEFKNEAERQLVRNKLENDYITGITLDALNSNTYDMLVAYMQNENVQNAIAGTKLNDGSSIGNYMNSLVKKMEEIKELYNKNLVHANIQAGIINKNKYLTEGKIPLTYIQQVAVYNTKKQLGINDIDKRIGILEESLNDMLQPAGFSQEERPQLERDAYIGYLTETYARLEADKKVLKEGNEVDREGRPLTKWAIASNLNAIEEAQDRVKQELTTLYEGSEQGQILGGFLNMFREAKRYKRVGPNSYVSEQFKINDEEIIKEHGDVFTKERVGEISQEAITQLADKAYDNLQEAASDKGLRGKSEQLWNTLINIATLRGQKAVEQSFLRTTTAQLTEYFDNLHNLHNQARADIVKKASDTIFEIYKKYAGDNTQNPVEDVVLALYRNNAEEAENIADEKLTGKETSAQDAKDLLDALKTINFSFAANNYSYNYILKVINRYKELTNPDKVKSTTSENASQSQQNQSLNNTSPQSDQANRGQGNRQTDNLNQQNGYNLVDIQNDTRDKKRVSFSRDADGKLNTLQETPNGQTSNLIGLVNDDGTVEVAISELQDEDTFKYLTSQTDIFDIDGRVLANNTGIKISSNPIVKLNGTKLEVITKGEIVPDVVDTGEPPVQDDTTEGQPPTNSSKGGLKPNSNVPPEEQHEEQPEGQPEVDQRLIDEHEHFMYRKIKEHTDENAEDFDEEAIRNAVLNDINTYNSEHPEIAISQDEIDNNLETVLARNKRTFYLKKKQKSMLAKTAMDLADETYAARLEESEGLGFNDYFKTAVANFVKYYLDTTLVPEINGKKVVNLHDIVKLFKEANYISDDIINNIIYPTLKTFFSSAEGRELYTLVTNDIHNEENIVNEIDKSADDIIEEQQGSFIQERVMLFTDNDMAEEDVVFDTSDRQTANVVRKAVSALRPGDELVCLKDETAIFVNTKDGVSIGCLPIPMSWGSNTYSMYNNDIFTGMQLDTEGNVVSDFKEILLHVLTDEDAECADIREILTESLINKPLLFANNLTNDDRTTLNELLNKFSNNPIISNLINESIRTWDFGDSMSYDEQPMFKVRTRQVKTENEKRQIVTKEEPYVDIKKVLQGFVQLYQVANSRAASSKEERIDNIKSLTNRWFNKLHKVYTEIANCPDTFSTTVATVVAGEAIKIYPNGVEALQHYNELLYPSQALGKETKARLCMNSTDVEGEIIYSDPSTIDSNLPITQTRHGISAGQTGVAIFTGRKDPELVNMYPLQLDNEQDKQNELYAKIRIAAHVKIYEGIMQVLNGSRNPEDIVELFSEYLYTGPSNNIPILAPNHNSRSRMFNVKAGQLIRNSDAELVQIQLDDIDGSDKLNISFYTKTKNGGVPGFQITIKNKNTDQVTNITKYKNGDRESSLILMFDPKERDKQVKQFVKLALNEIEKRSIIHMSPNGINSDNDKRDINTGYIQRRKVNGVSKLFLNIQTSEPQYSIQREFDSYNDFILKNDLCRLNTQPGEDEDNLRKDVTNMYNNPRLVINMRTSSTPVENMNEDEPKGTQPTNPPKDSLTKEKLVQTVRSGGFVGNNLAREILGEDQYSTLEKQAVASNISLSDILPTNVVYEPNYNRQTTNAEGRVLWNGNVAEASVEGKTKLTLFTADGRTTTKNIPAGTVIVGDRWMAMARNDGKQSIRKLIHENIHIRLSKLSNEDRTDLFNRLSPIAKEAWFSLRKDMDALESMSSRTSEQELKLRRLKNIFEGLRYYTNERINRISDENKLTASDRFYEEFMTEALTNRDFFEYMNSVIVTDAGTNEKKSIWSKIIDFITSFFGWKVNDKSLYNKFLNTLRNIETVQTSETKAKPSDTKIPQGAISDEEVNEIEQQSISYPENASNALKAAIDKVNEYREWQKQHIRFDAKDHKYFYVEDDSSTPVPIDYSVTQYNDDLLGNEEPQGDYSHSSEMGNEVDAMTREFFLGIDVTKRHYPNLDGARKENLLKDLQRFKEHLDRTYPKGYKVITNEVTLVGTVAHPTYGFVTIAGTMDMLVLDNEGVPHIYDMKAKNKGVNKRDIDIYTLQQNGYRQLLNVTTGLPMAPDLHLIWFEQTYPPLDEGKVSYSLDDNKVISISVTNDKNETKTEILKDTNMWSGPRLKDDINKSLPELEIKDTYTYVDKYTSIQQDVDDYQDDNNLVDYANSSQSQSTDDNFTIGSWDMVSGEDAFGTDSAFDFGDGDTYSSRMSEVGNLEGTLPVEVRNEFNDKINKGLITLTCK